MCVRRATPKLEILALCSSNAPKPKHILDGIFGAKQQYFSSQGEKHLDAKNKYAKGGSTLFSGVTPQGHGGRTNCKRAIFFCASCPPALQKAFVREQGV